VVVQLMRRSGRRARIYISNPDSAASQAGQREEEIGRLRLEVQALKMQLKRLSSRSMTQFKEFEAEVEGYKAREDDFLYKIKQLEEQIEEINDPGGAKRRKEAAAKNIVRRMLNKNLVGAFDSWKDTVQEQQELKRKARRVVERLLNRSKVLALETWAEHAQEQREARDRARGAVKRMLNAGKVCVCVCMHVCLVCPANMRRRGRGRGWGEKLHKGTRQAGREREGGRGSAALQQKAV